jgi:hypothetical protein
MAKLPKAGAQKRPVRSRTEESLSLRSAESLGRMIGTLQRQLNHVMRRMHHNGVNVDADGSHPPPAGNDTTPREKPVPRRRKIAAEPPLPPRRAAAGRPTRATRATRGASTKMAKRVSRPK